MDREVLHQQYMGIRRQTDDPDAWIETAIGSDLWVDGLNVFLTVDEESFQESLDLFFARYSLPTDSKVRCLEHLHQYCVEMAKVGEYELYQALALGMTWLSLQEETNGQFFNIPVQVTNHSTAILLSPTYRTLWLRTFNEGLTLFADLETKLSTIFRPEHGCIYQKKSWLQSGERVRYPYGHYFHEMAHILLFADLYSRVLTEDPAEEVSLFVHLEACIGTYEEQVLAELNAVCLDLNLTDDHFGTIAGFDEAGAFRRAVFRGEVEGVTPRDLAHYMKREMQCGEGDIEIPDNSFKAQIFSQYEMAPEVKAKIDGPYGAFLHNLQHHSYWGHAAAKRNRMPAFREVIELVELEPFYHEKLADSLNPERWQSPDVLLPVGQDEVPEPCLETRMRNVHKWSLKERVHRIAEIRGYLQELDAALYERILQELFTEAAEIAQLLTGAHWEVSLETVDARLLDILSRIADGELREKTSQMFAHRFSYLLEPR